MENDRQGSVAWRGWTTALACLLVGACAMTEVAAAGEPKAGAGRGRVVVGGHYRYQRRCVTVTKLRDGAVHYRWEQDNARGSGVMPADQLGRACKLAKKAPLRRGPLNAAEAKLMVAAHDALRAKYRAPGLRWSATIATYAQRWALRLAKQKRCGLEHRRTHRYGENLAMWGGGGALREPPSKAVDQWAGEFRVWDRSRIFTRASFPAGHLTQILWRGSKEVGCGRATCGDDRVVIVCNYAPAGNVLGQKIY